MSSIRYWFSLFYTPQKILSFALVTTFAVFLGVLFSETTKMHVAVYLGLSKKSEILKFVGISMGGILIALQALASHRRAAVMEEKVASTEQRLLRERFKDAIDHLGHESESVRLGGGYELFHLAEDTEEDFQQAALDVLCAHIRQKTGADEYQKQHELEPSAEIQSLIMLLFVYGKEVFSGLYVNLQGSWLNGVQIPNGQLQEVDLAGAQLQMANLVEACLNGASLFDVHLEGAFLEGAHLDGADLNRAHLLDADLGNARLRGADLSEANLQLVNLSSAQLQGAILQDVHLQGANIENAQICGVRSDEVSSDPDSFEQRIRQSIDRDSDVSSVVFKGGVSQKDIELSYVRSLADDDAEELRQKLAPHIDKPASNVLPKNSGAILGSYTAEDAKLWIYEYEDATGEASENEG